MKMMKIYFLCLPFHEVPCMVDTVLVNVDPSSGKYLGYIHAGKHKQKYLILFFGFFLRHQVWCSLSQFMKMITNYGNKIIFASNQSLAYTPDSMGLKLKKGTYSMVIWLCMNIEFYECHG